MDWDTVKEYVNQYGYLAVAVGTLIDQSGLQSFVVAGGVVALLSPGFHLWGVILAGAVGSLASDLVLWGLGRWRAAWLERIVRTEKGKARLKVLQEGMNRYAFPLIAVGRLMPWIGRFVPAAAGLRRVPFWKVAAFATIGALGTSAGYALIGYYAAESISWLDNYAIWIWLGALALSIPIAGLLLKRFDHIVIERLKKEQDGERPD
jgi:membrane protein DedA with SNARE-associated domain